MRKIICASLMAVGLFSFTGCEDYLDVNTNPNGPDALLQPELFLPQIQSELAVGMQWDGRFAGFYVQNWGHSDVEYPLDLHANPLSDSYAQLWKAVYFSMGYNLSDMIESAEKSQKYDFVGVGHTLRAFGWQALTDYHGPVIVTEAFNTDKRVFNYDEQNVVYAEIQRLANLGIENLERTDGLDAANSGLKESDLIYAGDREKWKKFSYGLLAINAHRLSNKSSYDPNKVIELVDKSFTSNADDAMIRFQGEISANTSFFGPLRGNIGNYRQTKFIVGLLDGTNPELTDEALVGEDPAEVFAGQHLKDPRLTAMLAPSPDGQYRGVTPGVGVSEWTKAQAAQVPNNLWNGVGNSATSTGSRIYFFGNDAKFPLMTYAQLQFIKAEAAWIANKKDVALEAYTKAVKAHMDFARQYETNKVLFDQRRAEYMASEELMPTTVDELTLSKIMLQKYIATWGWGFLETWSDMRRYHYDLDQPMQVYKGFELPETLYITNEGKPAYRARPRYNSEYMWNKEALEKMGGFNEDYHTYEMWFTKSE